VATIVLLEHQLQPRLAIPYMAYEFARRWEAAGHRVLYHRGTAPPPPGDVAILHVDLTVIPEPYRDLGKTYARVINQATWDLRKSRYTQAKLARGDAWPGPVIIKTEGNHAGNIDDALRRTELAEAMASDIPKWAVMQDYIVCESSARVPDAIWDMPGALVEKYIPERDASGANYLRVWTFFGTEERSSRYLSYAPMVRAANYVSRETVAVPDEMRALREKLGFDYGKFDYVRHDGRYVLLDANRTPAAPAFIANNPEIAASFDRIAHGIDGFL
jgi:hypothetical protein